MIGDAVWHVAGHFPDLPPTPKPMGKGAAVPDRTVRMGGYAGHLVEDPTAARRAHKKVHEDAVGDELCED